MVHHLIVRVVSGALAFMMVCDSAIASYTPSFPRWRVDANISGANPTLGTSAQTAYVGIEDGSLTLTNNTSSARILVPGASIPCSGTNAPSGTTCSAGNESVGVSFTPGAWTGDLRACVSFAHHLYFASTIGSVYAVFQIVKTASNAQTILEQGKDRTEDAFRSVQTTNDAWITFPHKVCGTFTHTTSGSITLRLMYEQSVSGTFSLNRLQADASANEGQRDIHWEVYPLNQ